MIFKGEAVCNNPPPPQTHRSDSGSQKCPCQRATVRNHARAPSVKADLGTKWQVSGTLHPLPTPPSLGAGAKLRVPPPRALYAHAGLRSRNPPRVRVCAGAPIIAVIFLIMGVRGGDSAQPGSSHL